MGRRTCTDRDSARTSRARSFICCAAAQTTRLVIITPQLPSIHCIPRLHSPHRGCDASLPLRFIIPLSKSTFVRVRSSRQARVRDVVRRWQRAALFPADVCARPIHTGHRNTHTTRQVCEAILNPTADKKDGTAAAAPSTAVPVTSLHCRGPLTAGRPSRPMISTTARTTTMRCALRSCVGSGWKMRRRPATRLQPRRRQQLPRPRWTRRKCRR